MTKKVLGLKSQRVIANYWSEIENVFTLYVKKNYVRSKLFLTWEEIKVQGKGLRLATIYVFLYEAGILPFSMSIDQFNEICSKTVITQSEKLQYFYQDKKIRVMLKRPANDTDSSSLKIDGDPCVLIHDFMLLLCKVGVEIIKMTSDSKIDTCVTLEKFFRECLFFRTNEEVSMNQFPFESKTKFHAYLQKLSGQLLGLENDADCQEPNNDEQKMMELENMSKVQDEFLTLENILQSFKSHFSLQKLTDFSTYKLFKEDDIKVKPSSAKPDKQADSKVVVIGVDIPVPKQRNEVKKAPVKTKPEKPIPYEKHPEPTPTTNSTHALNFYRVLIKDSAYQDFRDQSIDPKKLNLELMYVNIPTPEFGSNSDCLEFFHCFIAGCKTGNFNMAGNVLTKLTKIIEDEFRDNQELLILSQFLQGVLFEHMEEFAFAANCFYRCLRLYDK